MKKLFFALVSLLLLASNAFADCTEVITSHTIETKGNYLIPFNGKKANKVTLAVSRESGWATNELEIYQVINNENIKVEFFIPSKNAQNKSYEISPDATGLYFYNSMKSFKVFLNDIKITYPETINIPTNPIDFGSVALNSNNNKTFKVDYSALSGDLKVKLAQQDNVFSTSLTGASTNEVIIGEDNCSYGSKDITIYFKPTACGVYTNQLEFSNGTKVNVYGECSKRVCTNLEVVKISYTSVLLKWNKVEDADLSGFQIINQTTGAIYDADKDKTSLNVTGLEMGKNYSFVIFPILNGVKSLCASNIVTITTNKTDKIKECLIYTSVGKSNNEQNLIASDAIDDLISYDIKSGNSNSLKYTKRVTFEARWGKWGLIEPSMGALGDMCMYVKVEGESGFREEKYWSAANVNLTKTYQTFSAIIPHNTVAIEFRTGLANGACYRYVKNLQVYKDYILETETPISELDFGEVEPNVSVSKSFKVTYAHDIVLSEIAYDNAMKTIISDGLGVYTVNYKDFDDCAQGEDQEVIVTFTPTNCAKEYNATLTLINGAVLDIPLKGTLKRNPGTVSEITWTGAVDTNWDNRANWKKADGVLSVADVLDAKLKVNIPAGLTRYPVIPDVSTPKAFKEDRDKACDCAQVNAGDNTTATMIADKIYMESGAALVGVETLNADDVSRYGEVKIDFTPVRCYTNKEGQLRYDWSLVGPVVKPWDEENPGNTRDVVSGDYYKNDLPHVYMHEAIVKEDNVADWDVSFSSLTVKIPHDKAFAIRMPNQYGRNSSGNGIPAQVYNRKNGTNYDHKEDIKFTFTGRFYNEASLPTYKGLEPGKPEILNNTYPANIDAVKLNNKFGQILCFNGISFTDVNEIPNAVILSHHGFVLSPAVTEFTIPAECFQTTGVVENRSAETEVQSFRLQLKNEEVDGIYNSVYICHDELKEDAANYFVDAPKLFNDMEENLADLYVMRYDSKWAGLTVPTVEESLPLGIKVRTANQKHKFNLVSSNLDYDIILEDRQEAKEYNLSAGEVCEVSDLAVGDCRGRFYLKTTESADTPTDIVEEEEEISSIDIYANGNSITVSSDDNIRNIIVSDLSGRQMNYNVNGQYIVLDMPVSSGIYTVNVIGDKTSKIAKVKLN